MINYFNTHLFYSLPLLLILQLVVMSNTHRCNICKKQAQEPLNLRCDHHPCYQCGQGLTTVDANSKMEVKYQIICPTCTKRTVFYDLRHLILVQQNSNDDEELFVTDKFVSSKTQPKISNTPRGEMQSGESSQNMTRRGSIQSIANNNKMLVQVRCSQHNEIYKYFCVDCCDKGNRCLVCAECAKPHYSAGHRLLTIKQAESRLLNYNMRNKQDMLVKTGEISFMKQALNNNKSVIGDQYRKLEQSLTFEFEKVIESLNQNYQRAKAVLQDHLAANLHEMDERLQKLSSHQSILQSLKEIQLKDLETSMKFYQTYEKYTLTNQLSTIKVDLDSVRFPFLQAKVEQFASLALDWMEVIVPEGWPSNKGKTRKNSALEEPLSHRSVRDKQNKRIALCQANLNFKKIPN